MLYSTLSREQTLFAKWYIERWQARCNFLTWDKTWAMLKHLRNPFTAIYSEPYLSLLMCTLYMYIVNAYWIHTTYNVHMHTLYFWHLRHFFLQTTAKSFYTHTTQYQGAAYSHFRKEKEMDPIPSQKSSQPPFAIHPAHFKFYFVTHKIHKYYKRYMQCESRTHR